MTFYVQVIIKLFYNEGKEFNSIQNMFIAEVMYMMCIVSDIYVRFAEVM